MHVLTAWSEKNVAYCPKVKICKSKIQTIDNKLKLNLRARKRILTIFCKRDDFQHLTIFGKYLKRKITLIFRKMYAKNYWCQRGTSVRVVIVMIDNLFNVGKA